MSKCSYSSEHLDFRSTENCSSKILLDFFFWPVLLYLHTILHVCYFFVVLIFCMLLAATFKLAIVCVLNTLNNK